MTNPGIRSSLETHSRRWKTTLRLEIVIRVVADTLLVSCGLAIGLVFRLIGLYLFMPESIRATSLNRAVSDLLGFLGSAAPLLTAVSLIAFATSGFYSRGRFYSSRYKVAIILQAVSLAYVIAGFLSYFLPFFHELPRSTLISGWAATSVLILASRLWASIWAGVVIREVRIFGSGRRDKAMSTVLVIGGAGYVGSVLCRQLLNEGYRIRILDALLYGDESIKGLLARSDCEFVHGDSRDVESVVRAMRNMDAVIHLGEVVGDPASALDEKLTREINVAGTRMVAQAAKGAGVRRFIYSSSCSVYGASDGWLDERSTLNPLSLYARAKIDAEAITLILQGESFEPVIFRLATVYGLSFRPRFDLVINLLAAKAAMVGEITVVGGEQWRPFIHVSDVARAFILALKARRAIVAGEIFNLGSDEQNLTIAGAAEAVKRTIPSARITVRSSDIDQRNYRVSFRKIRERLNFKPATTIEEGIREILAAIREGRVGHYSEVRYSNLKTFSEPSYLINLRSQSITELVEGITSSGRSPGVGDTL